MCKYNIPDTYKTIPCTLHVKDNTMFFERKKIPRSLHVKDNTTFLERKKNNTTFLARKRQDVAASDGLLDLVVDETV